MAKHKRKPGIGPALGPWEKREIPDGEGRRGWDILSATSDVIVYELEYEATADLISASPELLDACKAVLERFEDCVNCKGSGLEPDGTADNACSICGGLGKTCNATALYSELAGAVEKAEGK
jgi:hypothetical protein